MRDAVQPVRRDHDDIDDAAGVLAVAPALRSCLHHVPGPVQIGVDDGVPTFHREIDRGLRKLPAGAVDESINAAVRCPDLVEQSVDRVRLPNIRDMRRGLQVAGAQLRGEGVELVSVTADDRDMRA